MLRPLASLVVLALAACGGPTPAKPASDRTTTDSKPAKQPDTRVDVPPVADDARADDIARNSKAGPPRPRLAPTAGACAASTYPAAASLAAVVAANDVAGVRAAYTGTPLQQLIQSADAATGRTDDAVITVALLDTSALAQTAATTAIQSAMSQWMRHNLKIAAEDPDTTKRPPAWSAARCAWEHGLSVLGRDLQGRASEQSSETGRDDATIADDIDTFFKIDPSDERQLLPARQAIEKTWYRIVHRELAASAAFAREHDHPATARRALGLFHMIRDRLQDRNTSAIATIEDQLAGKPSAIDAAGIIKQIDIALIKRARKYCSEAVDPKFHATAAGAASVKEGETYTKIFLPAMRAALADQKFDAAAHMAAWQAYAEAVDSGEDKDEIKKLSDDLVHWNCAYQQVLGIRECTATADEVIKPAHVPKPR